MPDSERGGEIAWRVPVDVEFTVVSDRGPEADLLALDPRIVAIAVGERLRGRSGVSRFTCSGYEWRIGDIYAITPKAAA